MTTTYAPKQAATRGHCVQVGNIELYYEEYGAGQPGRIDSMVRIGVTSHFPDPARRIMRRASFGTMPQPTVSFTATALRFLDGPHSKQHP